TPTGRAARSLNEYRADALTDLLHQALLHPAGTCTNCDCNCTTTGNTGNGTYNGSTGGNSDGSANKGSANKGSANSDGSGIGSADTTGITGIGGTNYGNTGNGTSGGGAGAGSRFRARVPARINIHLTAATATGASEDPGYLDGYGHIPAGQARELAGESDSWYKFLTDPVTGTVTDIGRRSYQPPEDMKRLVRAKSPTCTGIGCDRDAASCELDHTIPFHRNRYGPDG
ncbi:13E12 repeat family protein, partial [Arthrobacter sp. A2-55]